jgi:hypothetical protein
MTFQSPNPTSNPTTNQIRILNSSNLKKNMKYPLTIKKKKTRMTIKTSLTTMMTRKWKNKITRKKRMRKAMIKRSKKRIKMKNKSKKGKKERLR